MLKSVDGLEKLVAHNLQTRDFSWRYRPHILIESTIQKFGFDIAEQCVTSSIESSTETCEQVRTTQQVHTILDNPLRKSDDNRQN